MENISYYSIAEIDNIFNSVDSKIIDLWKQTQGENKHQLYEIKRFLFQAKRTALSLSNTFNSFIRWSRFTYATIDIYTFIDLVYRLDFIQDKCPSLPRLIQEVAEIITNHNPIRSKLIEVLSENSSFPHILIITHHNDRLKLKHELSKLGFHNIYVTSWKRLGNDLYGLPKEEVLIIAIEPPTSGDDIFADKVSKILFYLNDESLDIVKEYISTMEIGSGNHPVYFIKSEKRCPITLRKMEEDLVAKHIEIPKKPSRRRKEDIIHIPTGKKVDVELSDILLDIKEWCRKEILRPSESKHRVQPRSSQATEQEENTILSEKNQELVLAIEKNRTSCILYPKHSLLYVAGSSTPIEAESLIGKYENKPKIISISKKGISIKVHLAEWLLNDFDVGTLQRGKYVWESFSDLLNDALLWIEYLRNEVATYTDENELAEKISNSGVYAKDTHHIRNWWTSSEGLIKTYTGEQIEIPVTERPKSRNDLDILAKVLNNVNFAENADKIWEAVVHIQSLRNHLLDVFNKLNLESEKLKEKTGSEAEKRFKEILETQDVPPFFIQWFNTLETFYAIEFKIIILNKNLPLFKRLNLNEIDGR